MPKPTDKPPGMPVVLVSYIPFLAGEAGEVIPASRLKELGAFIESMPSGNARACLWFEHGGKVAPVFVYPRGDTLAGHLVAWSEEKPVDWFNLYLKQRHNKYVFALIPKFEKSIERHRITSQLRMGYPLPKDTTYSIIFRSLHFVSGDSSAIGIVRDKISEDVSIGILDETHIDLEHPDESARKLDTDKINWFGPFKLGSNKDANKFLDSILDDATEPVRTSIKF